MTGNETNKIINELFESLLTRYQLALEESMKGSNFVFDSIDGMHYKCDKISLNGVGSYIDFPDCIKKKKKKINNKSEK